MEYYENRITEYLQALKRLPREGIQPDALRNLVGESGIRELREKGIVILMGDNGESMYRLTRYGENILKNPSY